jgi:PEP-CTERM motif
MKVSQRGRLALGSLVAMGALGVSTAYADTLTQADVSLIDSGSLGDFGPDTILAPGSINGGDSTDIGTDVLFAGEYITVGTTSLVYNIEGGISGGSSGCTFAETVGTCSGYDAGAFYRFSNLVFSNPLDVIQGITVSLSPGTSYTAGSGVSFTADSVTMDVGLNAIELPSNNDGTVNYGTITVDLTIGPSGTSPPPSVPEPATGALIGVGLALVGLARRRVRR